MVEDGVHNGQSASLALDSLGRPHISYIDDDPDDLRHVCNDGTGWAVQTVHAGYGKAPGTGLVMPRPALSLHNATVASCIIRGVFFAPLKPKNQEFSRVFSTFLGWNRGCVAENHTCPRRFVCPPGMGWREGWYGKAQGSRSKARAKAATRTSLGARCRGTAGGGVSSMATARQGRGCTPVRRRIFRPEKRVFAMTYGSVVGDALVCGNPSMGRSGPVRSCLDVSG